MPSFDSITGKQMRILVSEFCRTKGERLEEGFAGGTNMIQS